MELSGKAREKYISYKRDIARLQHEHEKLSLQIRKHKKNGFPVDDLMVCRFEILEEMAFLKNKKTQLYSSIELSRENYLSNLYKAVYDVVEKTVSSEVFNKIIEKAKKEIS